MFTTTVASLIRSARDTRVWRPAHAKLLLDQEIDRGRNERAAYGDAEHLRAAAVWLERAQDATGNGGVAGRYRLRSGWTAAYPETTGYIVSTFLALANEAGGARFHGRAARAIDFLLSLQLPSGAFPGGELGDNSEASFFNTGQILNGLVAWHGATGDPRSVEAACRAGDWLIGCQEQDGSFRRHLYHDIVTTYGAHASCWLAELGRHVGDRRYLDAARRHVDWVLTHVDRETGWFDLCGFTVEHHRVRRSVTHTVAYTLCGVLTTAEIVGHTAAIEAVERAALSIARRLELSGSLPGVLDHRWRAAATWTCLTGNAQMALVWFTLFERTSDSRFLNAALKAIDLVKRAQPMTSAHPGIHGGIPGSDPIWGGYIRMAIPNWSAKFFIDALLRKRAILATLSSRRRGIARLMSDVPAMPPDVPRPSPSQPPRVVVLATPSSKKFVRMTETWQWGFRPAAVVMLARRQPGRWQRLRERIRNEGFGFAWHERSRSTTSRATSDSRQSGSADVRACCATAGIPVLTVDSFDSVEALDAIKRVQPDLFVFAGGAILRAPLLAIPRLGTLNAHMGVLPFYRGMNVAEWACFHGDIVGCSVHLIDPGIDTGDILCVRPVSTVGARSVAAVRDRVDETQLQLLGEVVRYVVSTGTLPPRRSQTASEGRQFFRMHGDLVEVLERELSIGDAAVADESLTSVAVGL
jgi:folate-dependent phosphoribosylglycinamide formyltransferase PurN